jgi:hypothetical protein
MNTKRKIVVVTALGIVAVAVTAGWNFMASSADWPPQPYQVSSIAGVWTILGGNTIVTVSPEDPKSGAGFAYATHITSDPTVGGAVPGATSEAPCIFKYVRTGPNTWQTRGLAYFMKDAKPQPEVLMFLVMDDTITMTTADKVEWTLTDTAYLGTQDKDHDGLPDEGQQPIVVQPRTLQMKSL